MKLLGRLREVKASHVFVAGLATLFLISLLAAIRGGPGGPEGKYLDDKVGNEGPAYYEFKDGVVTLVVARNIKLSEGADVIALGKYARRGDRWVWTHESGVEIELRPGLFGIEFYDPGAKVYHTNAKGTVRVPRYWFPE